MNYIIEAITTLASLSAFVSMCLTVTCFRLNQKKDIDQDKLQVALDQANDFQDRDSFLGIFSQSDVFTVSGERKRVGRRWCLYICLISVLLIGLSRYIQ